MRHSPSRLAICLLIVACSALLGACRQAASIDPTPTGTPAPTAQATATLEPTLSPASATQDVSEATQVVTQPAERSHYTLTVALNYPAHFVAVDERVAYVNASSDSLSELMLMVDASYYPGTFALKSLAWEDESAVEGVQWETGRLRFPTRQPLAPGETIVFSINYELNLPSPQPSQETRPVPFGYTQRQTNLVDWYPFVPPYRDGQGWIAHQAGFFGEHLAYELVDFEVSLHVESAGLPVSVAGSAAATQEGDTYQYIHENARSFALSVSHEYQVFSSEVDGVQVLSYAFPYHAQAGEAVLETTAQALKLYNELFGPYPRDLISAVEADFLDGMEYDGMYFLSNGFYNLYQGRPGDYLVAIAAHETAHQWFYGLVGNDQAMEPWLDEALCTYTERLYYERYSPAALDWWWAYRVNYYEPRGWVDGSIYNPEGYRSYRDAIYLNGAVYLEELREAIGDETFYAFLKAYVQANRGRIATGEDFFRILGEWTAQDLESLTASYFSTKDIP